MFNKPQLSFSLFLLGIILLVLSPNILSEGMFPDGLTYATIARNMSEGTGTLWNPRFTNTYDYDFHGQPPLAFGLQATFYYLFGDVRYIDKLYSLFTFLVVAYLMVKIWNQLIGKKAWIPIALWVTIPMVLWACGNNILENTMSIFTTLSVLLSLKYFSNGRTIFLVFSGFALSFGFLSKGFVAFFPWSFPFFWWMMVQKDSFAVATKNTILLIISTLVPLILLFLLSDDAYHYIQRYFNAQVVNSLNSVKTVDSRLHILKVMLEELLPAIIICGILLWYGTKRKVIEVQEILKQKQAAAFLLLALSGVIPITISMKQSGYYILAAMPFFAIAFGVWINPVVETLLSKLDYSSKAWKGFHIFAYVLVIGGILSCLYFSNKISRDHTLIKDTHVILDELENGAVINVSKELGENWKLYAHAFRNKKVSLDIHLENQKEFLLINKQEFNDSLLSSYTIIKTSASDFILLRRN